MTTYSLDGFAAVHDSASDTLLSVQDVSLDIAWLSGAAPRLRYDYLDIAGGSLAVALSLIGASGSHIGELALDQDGLTVSDDIFTVDWDENGTARTTTILARMIGGADLQGLDPGRSLITMFALGGDPLPPMPSLGYFSLFILTRIDDTSLRVPAGALAPGQVIAAADLSLSLAGEDDGVVAAPGGDTLDAGAGDDTLTGKAGADSLSGGAGNDRISGGAGRDTLDGGAGRDTLSYLDDGGGAGVIVSLFAGTARDSWGDADVISGFEDVQGSRWADRLTGNSGANRLWGYGGADSLNGGAGNDSLTGGAGDDTLAGGGGADWVLYGGDGGPSGIRLDLATGLATDSWGDTDLLSGIAHVEGSKYADKIYGSDIANLLQGGAGDDTLYGRGGADTLSGGAGEDVLTGGSGADLLDGGDGFDTVSYRIEAGHGIALDLETGRVTDGGGSVDTLVSIEVAEGSEFDDTLRAAAAGSLLFGAGGNDLFFGGSGSDTLSGDAGDDRFAGGPGIDWISGGDGIDLLDFSLETGTKAVNVDLAAGLARDTTGTKDRIEKIEGVIGTALGDMLKGDGGANILDGQGGNDRFYGRAGDDLIEGGDGRDTIIAGIGNDTARGGADDDRLTGSYGNDVLSGDAGNDDLRGGPGQDLLEGGDGDDTINGNEGRDTIHGGAGDDYVLGYVGADRIWGEAGNDTLFGNSEDDMVDGGDGRDLVYGNDGNDTLYGGAGDDMLSDGPGRDLVHGGAGNDTIRAGPDADTLSGDAGADQFEFSAPARADLDVITDFEPGTDLLVVAGFDAAAHAPERFDWADADHAGTRLVFGNLTVLLWGVGADIPLSDIL